MPCISIIILNWNGYEDTSELLRSLQNLKSHKLEILIVDNNSTGNDVEKLENNYKGFIKVLKCKTNLGFAGGNNIGIKQALKDGAEFILLLNNDTVVEPNFLSSLLKVFENNKDAGIVAPRINYYSKTNKIWTAGGNISRIRGSGFAYSDKDENEADKGNEIVSFVSGCCMLIKKEIFENVGLFDEKYFLYIEDTDLCYRIRKAGYKIYVSQDSKIYHKVRSSTSHKFDQLPIYYVTRNRLYFARKSFRSTYLITLIYMFLVMLLKSFLWTFSGKFENIISVKWAFTDFFKGNMGKTDHNKFKVK